MSLSVVYATFNEEKNLPDSLQSIKDLADEIVIVDGTSTDKTVEIARAFGARVLVRDNPPIFHINKQIAIDMAKMNWVLQLDADEQVTPGLAEEIRGIVKNKNAADGYWIPRKNWFLGRFLMKGGVYPDYTLRLYRKGKGHLPQRDVHEQAVVQGKVDYIKHPLIHMADPYFGRYLLRFDRYTTLLAKELREKKVKKNFYSFLKYTIALPIYWFLLVYIRHKGFMDMWQGFIFALFSALRFPTAFIKYLQM